MPAPPLRGEFRASGTPNGIRASGFRELQTESAPADFANSKRNRRQRISQAHQLGRYPRPPVRVDEHTIEVGGASVYYRDAPATGVVALFLHSAPTSSDDWTPFLERTGGIAPDLIGFGRSDKAGNLDYSLSAHAVFVDELLDALGVQRVQLVGHGWGAAIGLVFAQRHPERIERLVVCNAIPLLDSLRWPRFVRWLRRPIAGELLMGSTSRRLLARALRAGSVRPDAWPDARIAEVWEQFDQGTQRAILRLHRSVDATRLAAAGADLGRLGQPSLVVWGERDPWLAPAFADAYAARLPRASLRRIPDAGHWPWLDQPTVIDLVTAFLQAPHATPMLGGSPGPAHR
jgi:pimeloyl-ACP methyl ester carboxylesterase